MRSRLLTLSVFLGLLVTAGIAAAIDGEFSDPDDRGMPAFLEEGAELPPGLEKRDSLPPGLAKKLGDWTPPGQAKKDGDGTAPGQAKKDGDWSPPGLLMKGEGWLPPGLSKEGKIPPGHAKRLGVEPTVTDEADEG